MHAWINTPFGSSHTGMQSSMAVFRISYTQCRAKNASAHLRTRARACHSTSLRGLATLSCFFACALPRISKCSCHVSIYTPNPTTEACMNKAPHRSLPHKRESPTSHDCSRGFHVSLSAHYSRCVFAQVSPQGVASLSICSTYSSLQRPHRECGPRHAIAQPFEG
jgi:hypothetical protein